MGGAAARCEPCVPSCFMLTNPPPFFLSRKYKHVHAVPHGVSALRGGERYSIIILLSDPVDASGVPLAAPPRPRLSDEMWQALLDLQERARAERDRLSSDKNR